MKITTVTLKIISGQSFPKTGEAKVDPYVTVRILGHPSDHFKFTTKAISNNGLIILALCLKILIY